ncbi:MAG: 16S rRNA (cytosine(1402)-N(4))-methyltransferase RsmH [Nitrospirae bacterium]|nr:16S rRNA (cytosine(1402)-N(4))-methyltransferase RsmH [Nitrospirota bacterium]
MGIAHVPVMPEEVMEGLKISEGGAYVDATVGLGGHAGLILEKAKGCSLIGIDRDGEVLASAKERFKGMENVHLAKGRFSELKPILNSFGFSGADGILFDIGVSTMQLKAEGRGFSFLKDEPLDMRMDREGRLTAEDVVNEYSEKGLAEIIWRFGEEKSSRRIARAIASERKKKRIRTCRELALLIEKAVRGRGRIHPATRTFQALRIEVNGELDELSAGLESGAEVLKPGGRLCVLSYHSLEDRIVKNAFRELARKGMFHIITKKPLLPSREEARINPSSRSAKLRIAERI